MPKQPPSEVDAVTTTIPAPVGGWNARDSLAAMRSTDAVVLDNIYPSTSTVNLRPGKVEWVTGMTGNGVSFLAYNSASQHQLFCGTNVGIFNVTGPTSTPAQVDSCTNGRWESLNFTNSGGSFLLAGNGVDDMKLYDGSTWGNPVITGLTAAEVNNLSLFKRRVWLVPNQSMSVYYLEIDAIQGPATEFPMGPIFARGGYIVAQYTWTIDGGQGIDDYLVTVTSEGELAIYQGTDPDDITTFSLVGVYYAGQPVGKRCFAKYGGDILYLSQQGLFPLSKLLLSATIDRSIAVSDKISGAFSSATETFGQVFGWQTVVFPNQNAILVNVPIAESNTSYQYVMNSTTQAWCRFTNWDSAVLVLFENALYGAINGSVYLLWSGLSDAGAEIEGTCAQAYNNYGKGYQKRIKLVRPNIGVSAQATLSLAFDNDYKAFAGETMIDYAVSGNPAVWDSAVWDTAVWDVGLAPTETYWTTVPNEPGYLYSMRLSLSTATSQFSWTSTDLAFSRAGVL